MVEDGKGRSVERDSNKETKNINLREGERDSEIRWDMEVNRGRRETRINDDCNGRKRGNMGSEDESRNDKTEGNICKCACSCDLFHMTICVHCGLRLVVEREGTDQQPRDHGTPAVSRCSMNSGPHDLTHNVNDNTTEVDSINDLPNVNNECRPGVKSTPQIHPTLKLLCLNTCGLASKIDFIDSSLDNSDILVFTETKTDITSEATISDFFRKTRLPYFFQA